MSAQVRGQRRSRLRRILRGMRLNFITLGLLIVLTVLGLSLIRTSLLKNAQETGTALTQIYAAEGRATLPSTRRFSPSAPPPSATALPAKRPGRIWSPG